MCIQTWNRKLEAAPGQRRAKEARMVDELRPGEQQSEVDHGLTPERSFTGDLHDRKWRDARDSGYFAFQQKVLHGVPQVLRCTYWGEDEGGHARSTF